MAKTNVTKIIDGKQCVTTAFLAEAFDVTAKTLAEWKKQGCPQVSRGYWNLTEVIKWHENKLLDGIKTDDDKDLNLVEKKLYWETEYKKQKAEGEKLKNAISMGEYVSRTEAIKQLENFLSVFKQAVLILPRKIGISIQSLTEKETAREVENIASQEIEIALKEWSVGNFDGKDEK